MNWFQPWLGIELSISVMQETHRTALLNEIQRTGPKRPGLVGIGVFRI